jgi:hypothetical protein
MSITARQSELFAGESWTTLYQAFQSINFNATDPASINRALRDYIRINYPESFNDWLVSSEFVALLDLLSWLAGVLAYKTDLASRENFLDTAESRTSILRLARFLSYNPSRCQTSSGIAKIVAVKTDNDVFDSFGVNLADTEISWGDTNNPNWFEQLTLVLNDAFVTTNPFGVPLKTGTVAGVATQLYRVNGLASQSNFGFSANVSGINMDFEVCNGDFTDGGTLFERTPNPSNAVQFFYLNDGNGNSSTRTGFFLLFKQGSTSQQVFSIAVPIENQLLDVSSTNINSTDVWVQTVDDSGNVVVDWTIVPAILNSNITYNAIPVNQRNICAVLTRDNDQVTIRFSDGRFGNAPSGNIQVTYRVSNGLAYQINPQEIANVEMVIAYTTATGAPKNLTLTFSLFETVANSAATESIEQIRQRAPQVYATQGRMVSGEDYNTFPLATNLAVKIAAVNRVYSGQSRYIDLGDPTGTYQDLFLLAEDGIFFRDVTDTYFEVPSLLNQTPQQIINNYIQPVLNQYTTANLMRDVLLENARYILATVPSILWSTGRLIDVASLDLTWTQSSADLFQTTGNFSGVLNLIQPGSMVQFMIGSTVRWVGVTDIQGAINAPLVPNTAGPVTLSLEVPTGSTVTAVLPAVETQLSANVLATITNNLTKKLSFSLWYDYYNTNSSSGPTWVVDVPQNDFGAPEPELVGNLLLVMNVNYVSGIWRVNSRGLRYVFESINDIEWFDNGKRALSQQTGEAEMDTVSIMRINRNLLDVRGYALPQDYSLSIDRIWLYPDGTPEPRRVTVLYSDNDGDGLPDVPDLYFKIVSPTVADTHLFWSNLNNQPYEVPIYNVKVYDTYALRALDRPAIGTIGFQVTGDTYLTDETFHIFTSQGWVMDTTNSFRCRIGRGPNTAAMWMTATGALTPVSDQLAFKWQHYAPSDHRIDPAQTNIVDIFVLTAAYDATVRLWIANGADPAQRPQPPSELDLRLAFSALEDFKMFSDTVVWRPVQYRFLFGNGADDELRAQFKVVRLPNAAVSDGEIKTRIINAINSYFAVSNWDFGDTFYFTELAAYIHQQLVGLIGSIVLVPLASEAAFGDGFEISCRADEIFISTAQVSDIVMIGSNTAINLRIN